MKKQVEKILLSLLAFIMIFAAFSPVASAEPGETRVNIHKIMMNKTDYTNFGDPRDHDGSVITNITDYFGSSAVKAENVAFRFFEVKDTATAGFVKGDDASLAAYAGDLNPSKYYKLIKFKEDLVTSAYKPNTDGDAAEVVLTNTDGIAPVILPDGVYRVLEDKELSTYTGDGGAQITESKAVPFDLILPAGLPGGTGNYSVETPLNVYPKNTEQKSEADKDIDVDAFEAENPDSQVIQEKGALTVTQVTQTSGLEVPFIVDVTIPAKANYQTMVLNDTMSKGLTYNRDLKLYEKTVEGPLVTWTEITAPYGETYYTIVETDGGFVLQFADDGLAYLMGEAATADYTFYLKYSATVNEDIEVDTVEKNKITYHYSNNPGGHHTPVPVTPSSGQIAVTKEFDPSIPEPGSGLELTYTLYVKEFTNVEETEFIWVRARDAQGNLIAPVVRNAAPWGTTFTNLDNTKQYLVVETVNQDYLAEYSSTADGALTVENKKTPTVVPASPEVVNGGKKFVKADETTGVRLEGGQFVISRKLDANGDLIANSDTSTSVDATQYLAYKSDAQVAADYAAYTAAETKYQKAIEDWNKELADPTKIDESDGNPPSKPVRTITVDTVPYVGKTAVEAQLLVLRNQRNTAFAKVKTQWTWVATELAAYKFISNEKGQFEVTGLAYGDYQVVEYKAPYGYNLPNDREIAWFTVEDGSYSSGTVVYEDTDPVVDNVMGSDAVRLDNKEITIPQTGGIGTVIFVVAGLAIMAFAVIAMRRNNKKDNT